MDAIDAVDRVMEMLLIGGGEAYFGEPLTQLEHALQTAMLAEQDGAPDTLVAAALLHDIGHLLHGHAEDLAPHGVDGRHEQAAVPWLALHFPRAVTEPIRLHVTAKRFLCTVDPPYLERLSPASRESLAIQGGPMTPDEVAAFARTPWAAESVELRRWDDAAKLPGLAVPSLSHYRPLLERLVEGPAHGVSASRV